MPTNTQKLISQLNAQMTQRMDKPLQEPDIMGELGQRYLTPLIGKNNTRALLGAIPLALAISPLFGGGEVAGEEASGLPELIKKLVGKTEGLTSTGGEGLINSGKTERGISSHHTLGLAKLQKLYPEVADKTENLISPPIVEPLGRPTNPLKSIEVRTPGGRFHGSAMPITELKDPSEADSGFNLVGPGLYTSNNRVVTEGYAGFNRDMSHIGLNVDELIGKPGSVQYKVHQIAPVRWLNIEKPATPALRNRLKEALELGGWDKKDLDHFLPQGKESINTWMHRFSGGQAADPEWNFLKAAAEQEGYGGIQHTGGVMGGGRKHKVKVYWYPQEQVRMRPVKYSLSSTQQRGHTPEINALRALDSPGQIPKVGSFSSKAPKPKYVRDLLKTSKLSN